MVRSLALQHDWVIHADVDEHQDFPESVEAFLDKCGQRGINTVVGQFRDRVTRLRNPSAVHVLGLILHPALETAHFLRFRQPVTCQISFLCHATSPVYVHPTNEPRQSHTAALVCCWRLYDQSCRPPRVPHGR